MTLYNISDIILAVVVFPTPLGPLKAIISMNTPKIILATGCFHILHPDHIRLFSYAANYGNLIVGINSDEYLIKKSGKIIIPLSDRIYLIESIKYVSKVEIFNEPTACELIQKLRPDYFIKGPDYKDKEIPESILCNQLGINYLIAPHTYNHSTSKLLNLV